MPHNMNREEMIKSLKENICRVTFLKLNGDVRMMYCTLQESFLPKRPIQEKNNTITNRKEVPLIVWDIDVKGWRSFRVDSVTHFDSNPNAE